MTSLKLSTISAGLPQNPHLIELSSRQGIAIQILDDLNSKIRARDGTYFTVR